MGDAIVKASRRLLIQAGLVFAMGAYALASPRRAPAADLCLACDTNCVDAMRQLSGRCDGIVCGPGILCGDSSFDCSNPSFVFATCFWES